MGESKKYGINTRALHTQKRIELPTGDVMSPIHLTTTYANTVPGNQSIFMEELVIQLERFLKEPLLHLRGLKTMMNSQLWQCHLEWLQ